MTAKRLSIRGLYMFLTTTFDYQSVVLRQIIPFPQQQVPNRRTFDRRLKNWQLSVQLYMLQLVLLLVKRFKLGVARLAVDKRMFEAVGAIWHVKDMKKNHIPDKLHNIDTTAGWSTSHYRGWVFGHGMEVIVSTGKLVVPILASSHSLKQRGNRMVKTLISLLPKVKKGLIVADSEYFDFKLKAVAAQTGRAMQTPSSRYPSQVPNSKTYAKRKTTVEPYFERFLQAFVLRGKLDRKGPNAWGYLVTCCFLYQLMVFYNLLNRANHPLQVTHLIRIL